MTLNSLHLQPRLHLQLRLLQVLPGLFLHCVDFKLSDGYDTSKDAEISFSKGVENQKIHQSQATSWVSWCFWASQLAKTAAFASVETSCSSVPKMSGSLPSHHSHMSMDHKRIAVRTIGKSSRKERTKLSRSNSTQHCSTELNIYTVLFKKIPYFSCKGGICHSRFPHSFKISKPHSILSLKLTRISTQVKALRRTCKYITSRFSGRPLREEQRPRAPRHTHSSTMANHSQSTTVQIAASTSDCDQSNRCVSAKHHCTVGSWKVRNLNDASYSYIYIYMILMSARFPVHLI